MASMSKPIEQELTETLRTIRCLKAQSPDELEDYFHDSIVNILGKGRSIKGWLGYIYKTVEQRLRYGKEARPNIPLEESIVPAVERVSTDTKLDLRRALATLSERKRAYIEEYFYEGYTLEEIAQRHGVTNQYISAVIKQGLEDMRTVLDPSDTCGGNP